MDLTRSEKPLRASDTLEVQAGTFDEEGMNATGRITSHSGTCDAAKGQSLRWKFDPVHLMSPNVQSSGLPKAESA